MKNFTYEGAINNLDLGREEVINLINYEKIPKYIEGESFLKSFLPYLEIIGDSREQNNRIEKACNYYGISFTRAEKDKATGNENLKEGDYTFRVCFKRRIFDYIGLVSYERKGAVSEFYSNCTRDRQRIEREFDRFSEKKYKKVVLLLEFGETLLDLIHAKYTYRSYGGELIEKDVGYTLFSSVMCWKQSNNKDFDVLQSNSHETLFWLMMFDCYYYFRNDIKIECIKNNLIERE